GRSSEGSRPDPRASSSIANLPAAPEPPFCGLDERGTRFNDRSEPSVTAPRYRATWLLLGRRMWGHSGFRWVNNSLRRSAHLLGDACRRGLPCRSPTPRLSQVPRGSLYESLPPSFSGRRPR